MTDLDDLPFIAPDPDPTRTLDQVMADIEEVRPDYVLFRLTDAPGWGKFEVPRYEASVEWWEASDRRVETARADTPSAAVRALVEKVRSR